MARPGDLVVFARLPHWVDELQSPSREIFHFCHGRTYRIDEIDRYGLLVLDVSADIDDRFGGFMNDIRVEEEFVEVVKLGRGERGTAIRSGTPSSTP